MPRKHAGEFFDPIAKKKARPKKKEEETPEVPSVEDVIQSFHKFKQVKCAAGYYTIINSNGSARLIRTKSSSAEIVAIKDKIASALGNRILVRINLDFPDFTIVQLIAGNCKALDEIYDMTYQVIKQSSLKEVWNQKYDQRRFAEG